MNKGAQAGQPVLCVRGEGLPQAILLGVIPAPRAPVLTFQPCLLVPPFRLRPQSRAARFILLHLIRVGPAE